MKERPRKYLSRERLCQGARFTIYRDRILFPDGKRVFREWVNRPSIAAIVAVAPGGGFFLVRQHRYGINRTLWEVPAGTMSGGERPLECAKRECEEETGYRPARVVSLGFFVPSPAFSNEIVYLFAATGLEATSQNLDHDERLVVRRFSRSQVKRMLKTSGVMDAKSIIAFSRYFERT